jgi:ABC-type polysaccharide/polyol phosphate export permease
MDTATHMLRTGQRGTLFQLQMAGRDLRNSFGRLGLAWSLAWHDVSSRYRGSILGPFWITLSMGLMTLGIGFLYANLFSIELHIFLPYVALGIVFFAVMTGTINEGCDTFVQAAGILSQTSLAHHLVIVVGVLIFYGYWRTADAPMALLGLVLMVANASWLSLLVGIASARFRDIPQIVMSVMQFALFMSPVFWKPDRLKDYQAFLDLNPFYHLLEAVRAPLLGTPVAPGTYLFLVGMAVAGWLVTFLIFARTRRRIVHYL